MAHRKIKSSTGMVHVEGGHGRAVCSGNKIKGASYTTSPVTCSKCKRYGVK